MAELAQMTVTWRCPATTCRHSTGLRFNAVQGRGSIVMQMEPDDEDKVREHLKSHIAEIKAAWRALESGLGALGYAMDVTVSPGIDPDLTPTQEASCHCGHGVSRHKDRRDEWTACQKADCGCLGFAGVGQPEEEVDPW